MFDKNAVIVLNKPTGMSSFYAVKRVARILGVKKAGHMGTLDPYGSGVLLIGVNKATKLFEEYLQNVKTYIATFCFGYETDTLDSEGNIINENDVLVNDEDLKEKIKNFVGKLDQMPPMYSAKKINGKKACDLARQGESVVLKTKQVEIYEFNIVKMFSKNCYQFKITCSSGTYIRSLCRDLAYSLGTYGTMVSIIRTRCGIHNIEDACTFEDLQSGNFKYKEIDFE